MDTTTDGAIAYLALFDNSGQPDNIDCWEVTVAVEIDGDTSYAHYLGADADATPDSAQDDAATLLGRNGYPVNEDGWHEADSDEWAIDSVDLQGRECLELRIASVSVAR